MNALPLKYLYTCVHVWSDVLDDSTKCFQTILFPLCENIDYAKHVLVKLVFTCVQTGVC